MARIRSIKPEFHVYCVVEESASDGPCKIGIASNVASRVSALQGGNHRKLIAAWVLPAASASEARQAEQFALTLFRPTVYGGRNGERLQSEWVSCTPAAAKARVSRFLNALEVAQ